MEPKHAFPKLKLIANPLNVEDLCHHGTFNSSKWNDKTTQRQHPDYLRLDLTVKKTLPLVASNVKIVARHESRLLPSYILSVPDCKKPCLR